VKPFDFIVVNYGFFKFGLLISVHSPQALITQTRAKQAATMSEVEWRGRTVPVKIDKVRIFLLGLADNEAAIVQVTQEPSPVSVLIVFFILACEIKLDAWAKSFKITFSQTCGQKAKIKSGRSMLLNCSN